ncbi:hypothetical protein ES703_118553 [subsurface metagenome]
MAAGVSHLGQGIVFRKKGDGRFPRAIAPAKSGGQLANPLFDLKTVSLQVLRQPTGCLYLMETELGVLVNPQAQLNKLLSVSIHPPGRHRFQLLYSHFFALNPRSFWTVALILEIGLW